MKVLKLIRHALGTARSRQNGHATSKSDVLDQALFRRELLRHRALVDRAGGRFVLTIFDVPVHGAGASSGVALLSEVIRERARLSDVVGIYDASGLRVAALLPETTASGAATFVRSVDDLLRSRLNGHWRADAPLRCEISQYPDTIKTVSEDTPVRAQHEVVCGETRS